MRIIFRLIIQQMYLKEQEGNSFNNCSATKSLTKCCLNKTTYGVFLGAESKTTSFHFMDQVTSRYICNIWLFFFLFFFITLWGKKHTHTWKHSLRCYTCAADHILSILPEMFYLSHIYAHVGHKRGALSVVVDVVIIRHGARQEGGVHCLLCAACPMTE